MLGVLEMAAGADVAADESFLGQAGLFFADASNWQLLTSGKVQVYQQSPRWLPQPQAQYKQDIFFRNSSRQFMLDDIVAS